MTTPLRGDDPTRIGPYSLRARLGGGGMGQVFLGRSPGGHTVAVKVVRPELADDAAFRRRFAAEVRAARKVGGFYTAPVVDADPDADPPWLATAYIPGPSLHTAVTDHGPLPAASVAVLGAGLAEGLAAVHACDLVHRDLKPANVLLAADGPRLIDFGIARALDTTSHTQTSTVLGTAAFMSPEQARADEVGPASDAFSLGCVLAFAATGRSPFGQGPVHAVVFRVVHEEPDLSGLSDPLADLVGVCLAKDPAARPDLVHLLRELSALARSGGERWLPEAHTEAITRYGPLPPTLAEAGPERPGGKGIIGRLLRPATTRPQQNNGKGGPAQADPAPEIGPSRAPEGSANLVIGNLGPAPMGVTVDGTSLGQVPPRRNRAFPLDPGRHSVLVEAPGHPGVARRIQVEDGATTAMAFDTPEGSRPEPRPVQEVVFTIGSLPKVINLVTQIGIFAVCISAAILSIGYFTGKIQEEVLYLLGLMMFISMIISAPGYLFDSLTSFAPLTLDGERLKAKKVIEWDEIEQISIIGRGRDSRLALWPRKGQSLPEGLLPSGEKRSDGSHIGPVKRLGVKNERDLERLRAALRWFGGDAYLDQPG